MPLKILLTADVHLGLKFSAYPEIQSELTAARFDTLERVVSLANEKQCELLVIAGDLFDHHRVIDRDILKTTQILGSFQGKLAVVLPGNHDFIIPNDIKLWNKFKEKAGDRTLLLDEVKIYDLRHYDLDVNLYAGPCNSKHSAANNTGWISNCVKDSSVKYHIGVAHGSLDGVSPDPDKRYFPMSETELLAAGLDLWLLGHTDRLQYPANPSIFSKIFYPGTPEPNGFDCQHEGKVWILTLSDDKEIIPESFTTGKYKFRYDEFLVEKKELLSDIIRKYSSADPKSTLLKLKLRGRLPKNDFDELPLFIKNLKEILLYVEADINDIRAEITKDLLDKEFTTGSFPYQLLNSFGDDDLEKTALQIAYDLIREVRK